MATRRVLPLILLTLLLVAALLAAVNSILSHPTSAVVEEYPANSADRSFPYNEVAQFDQVDVKELSGIVFHPQRKTLFAVSDRGDVVEIQTDGVVVQQKKARQGGDFEGITCHPETGMLYVAVEGKELILELNPEFLEVTREIPINRSFKGQVLLDPEGNGIEDIALVPSTPNDIFYLVNQSDDLDGADPSIIFAVEVGEDQGQPTAHITNYFTVGLTDLSGLYYDSTNQHLFVTSDGHDLLLKVSLSGQVLATYPLPGTNQEGITLDEAGFLYIAQDSKKGILKFSPIGP